MFEGLKSMISLSPRNFQRKPRVGVFERLGIAVATRLLFQPQRRWNRFRLVVQLCSADMTIRPIEMLNHLLLRSCLN